MAAKATAQILEAKKNPQLMMMGFASFLDAVKVDSKGATFHLTVDLTQQQVDDLINRVKGDRNLVDTEIRVLAHDSEYMRVVPRPSSAAAQAVDQRGTRRAPRFKMAPKVMALVDGKHATLVDLSTIGAQIVSPAALKPNQMIPMTLSDEVGVVKFSAEVAWTSFEIPPNSGPRYRAGVEFVEADAMAVEAYCTRHRA